MTEPNTTSMSSVLRLIGITGFIAVALLVLPSSIQRLVFYSLILVGIVVGVVRLAEPVQQMAKKALSLYQTNPSYLPHISAGIALSLLLLSALFYQPQYSTKFGGFYFFLASLPFIGLALPVFSNSQPTTHTSTAPHSRLNYAAILVGMVSLAMLMTVNMPSEFKQAWHSTLGLIATPTWAQMLMLVIGLVSILYGFGVRIRPHTFRWKRHYWLLLLLVIVGGAVRLYDLEGVLRLFVDEFFFMTDVIQIRDGAPLLLYPNAGSTSDIYPFFQTLFVTALGPSLTSLRLVSPLIVMAGLVVLYGFVRQFFRVRVALISVLLLATLPVYVQFGRIGMNMIVDPIFALLAFCFFVRGMRSKRLADFAVAGVSLGMTHYFYEGGRLFFTLFMFCWIIWITLFARCDPQFRLPTWRESLVFLFCLLVTIAPVYHMLYQIDFTFTQRLDITRSPDFLLSDSISEFLLSSDIGHLGAPLHRYVGRIARDNFYRSEYAYVVPLLVPFFLLGFGICIWRLRRLSGSLLFWWAMGVAIGNTMITEYLSAPSPRHIVVYAILMVITAVGITTVWDMLDRHLKPPYRKIATGVFVIYLAYVSVFHINHYFNHTVPNYYMRVYNNISGNGYTKPAFDDMIMRVVELPENTWVHVYSEWLFPRSHAVTIPAFYERYRDDLKVNGYYIQQLDPLRIENLPRNVNHAFVFKRNHIALLDIIEEHFVVTEVTETPYDVPYSIEMLIAFAPQVENAPPEPIDMPFERPPTGQYAP